MNYRVCAASAVFPGLTALACLEKLSQGVQEPMWGVLSTEHVQLCPQTMGVLTDPHVDELMQRHPEVNFRLHANARVQPKHRLLDASTFSPETLDYYQDLARVSQRLNASAYSLHAGYAQHSSQQDMFEHVKRIQELFGDIPVAIEGLYPNRHREQLIDSWKGYEALLESGHYMAIDLSHLQIVARHEKHWEEGLVEALLSSEKCLEIHLSENDGYKDQHVLSLNAPLWVKYLEKAHTNAVLFSEGDQTRQVRAKPTSLLFS